MSSATETRVPPREWPCHYCGEPVKSYWYAGQGTIAHGRCVPSPPPGVGPPLEDYDRADIEMRRAQRRIGTESDDDIAALRSSWGDGPAGVFG